ncbi:hypothetical protein JW960_27500 [candidate division KSB1 bacterium]|nr:hypothetical protein [candidate division KSB1 bacterium]
MLLDEIKSIESSKKEQKKFGISVGIALLVIGVLMFFLKKESYPYFTGIGGGLLLSGWLIPGLLKYPYIAWMTFAAIMGWFMTRLILSVLFYVVFTLIGRLARLFGKQFLVLRPEKNKTSYWNYHDERMKEPDEYERQF